MNNDNFTIEFATEEIIFEIDGDNEIIFEVEAGISGDVSAINNSLLSKVTKSTLYTNTDAGTGITFDISLSSLQRRVMDGNKSFSVIGDETGRPFFITLDYSDDFSVTWFSGIKWENGSAPDLTGIVGRTDTFGFIKLGVNSYLGYVVALNQY